MHKQIKHTLAVLAVITTIAVLGNLILGAVLTKILFWSFIILGLALYLGLWVKRLFIITALLALSCGTATAQENHAGQEFWIPWPAISPHHLPIVWTHYRTNPTVQWTPAHSRRITNRDAWIYRITPYGGTNYRTNWTNYRPRDTSHGYRTGRPRAIDLGITRQKLNHPNPRSLYRP